MTVFIAGVDFAKGRVGDDDAPNRPYFELGWEVISTHFDVKRGKAEGWIDSQNDIIVTCSGREFLYATEFQNVVEYRAVSDFGTSGIVDFTQRYRDGSFHPNYFARGRPGKNSRSRFLTEHRDLALSIRRVETTSLHDEQPYCCLAARRRDHGAYRNMTCARGRYIIEHLLRLCPRVFLVGHDTDDLLIDDRVVPVDLVTYASLIANPLCMLVVGTMTGTMQLAALYSHAKLCIVISNYDSFDAEVDNSPVNLGPCIRISPSKFVFVPPSLFEPVFGAWVDALKSG
jgi:hypothetical protein